MDWDKLDQLDDIFAEDFNPNSPANDMQLRYIESLLCRAVIPQEEVNEIARLQGDFTWQEASAVIEHLLNNQPDPVTHGQNYNQTDIIKHIKKIL